jgi:sulfate adenylyltransferase subunit 2
VGGELIVCRNEGAIADRVNPFDLGTQRCCRFLKTEAFLTGLRHQGFDAASAAPAATRTRATW